MDYITIAHVGRAHSVSCVDVYHLFIHVWFLCLVVLGWINTLFTHSLQQAPSSARCQSPNCLHTTLFMVILLWLLTNTCVLTQVVKHWTICTLSSQAWVLFFILYSFCFSFSIAVSNLCDILHTSVYISYAWQWAYALLEHPYSVAILWTIVLW
jgi:hypothetical protein